MADHAGGRRSVVNPGTKLWRPLVEVTRFGTRGEILAIPTIEEKKCIVTKIDVLLYLSDIEPDVLQFVHGVVLREVPLPLKRTSELNIRPPLSLCH